MISYRSSADIWTLRVTSSGAIRPILCLGKALGATHQTPRSNISVVLLELVNVIC